MLSTPERYAQTLAGWAHLAILEEGHALRANPRLSSEYWRSREDYLTIVSIPNMMMEYGTSLKPNRRTAREAGISKMIWSRRTISDQY